MRGLLVAMVATHLLLSTGCARAGQTEADTLIAAQHASAVMGMKSGDFEMAMSAIEPATAPEIYDRLSTQKKYEVSRLYGFAALNTGSATQAHAALVKATSYPMADDTDWIARFQAAIQAKKADDLMPSMARLSKRKVAFLKEIPLAQLARLDQLLDQIPDRNAARILLGREMIRQDWRPIFAYDDPSEVWLNVVLALLATGQTKEAIATAARISEPTTIKSMHADRRLDGIVKAVDSLQNPEHAARTYLAAAETFSADNPRLLGGRIAVYGGLNSLGRDAEGLQVLEKAQMEAAASPRSDRAFYDMYELTNLTDLRASALVGLGRFDEAIGLRMSNAGWGGGYTISLGRTLMYVGRDREALTWFNRVQSATLDPKGEMRLAQYKTCAALILGEKAIAAEQLQFLAAHEDWMPEARLRALICAGDLDFAAQVLVRQLANPQQRMAALRIIQEPTPSDVSHNPYGTRLETGLAKLRANPAVRRQVEEVGRFVRYDVVGWESVL